MKKCIYIIFKIYIQAKNWLKFIDILFIYYTVCILLYLSTIYKVKCSQIRVLLTQQRYFYLVYIYIIYPTYKEYYNLNKFVFIIF